MTAEPKALILRHGDVCRPWQRLNIDLIGPLPASEDNHKYILSVVDMFTRYGIAIPLVDKSMVVVSRAMVDHVISPHGCPEEIFSDNGSELVGAAFRQAVKSLGISQKFITHFVPKRVAALNALTGLYNEFLGP